MDNERHEPMNPEGESSEGITMDDVYSYFERKRAEWDELRTKPENQDFRTNWMEQKAIDDLKNGDPSYALDQLNWAQGGEPHGFHEADREEALKILRFLENKFNRHGSHNLDEQE